MLFLANENFPAPSITVLRNSDHDVLSIQENVPGINDHEVISLAINERRIILTFDKDYGEIIFKDGMIDPPSVIFFRYRGKDPFAAAQLLLELMDGGTEITQRFTVIETDGIRQRIY